MAEYFSVDKLYHGYIQTGYVRSYGTLDEFFSQYAPPYTGPVPDHYYTVYGSYLSTYETTGGHHYRETYVPGSCDCIESQIDSSLFQHEPIQTWAEPGKGAQSDQTIMGQFGAVFGGETTYEASDIPGTASVPTPFTSIQYQVDFSPYQFFGIAGGFGAQTTNYSGNVVSPNVCNLNWRWDYNRGLIPSNEYDIWTSRSGIYTDGSCPAGS